MSPTAPAARARSMRASICVPRADPVHLEERLGDAATTSSIGLLANELSPMAVPRAAAARATATSPSGCTAWTPVGEMSTGNEISWPMTLVTRSRLSARPGHVRGEAQLGVRVHVVLDGDAALGAGDERAVDGLGQAALGPPLRLGHRLEPLVAIPTLS